ncbi:hypothetical protein N7468_010384 [Penicillium chermesinum]|uniref:Phospholipid/glycerol acyltransferase domain-containing protein n=1 Tax=Penicillium chermesinum TaxID=63820 RepID=A0A9W9NCK5_9EURO|nr:uncharacterized protein N7468_010384 [Penicillium chermesinum]KAJ5217376.1 hypothetical protein N7468_010384 [Penicillium chermesinum]
MGKKQPYIPPLIGWLYDLTLWTFSVLIDLFFREVHPRGSWKIPRRGPIIIVAAPHANQFVDSLILMRVIRSEAHRRISWLIAEKSFRRKFIGMLARGIGALPVARAMDSLKAGSGTVYLPDPVNEPTLLRGVGTNFEGPGFEPEGTIALPTINGTSHSTTIAEIRGPEELVLKKPFKHPDAIFQLTGRKDVDEKGNFTGDGPKDPEFKGSKFKFAPHVDQTAVYEAVFGRLNAGGCVGIFPEGGSHDRPSLLPLKAGVALMALGTLADNPDCGLKIVPTGMNYFHAHKFRSRAVIEFGNPLEVPKELVEQFKRGERREAVGALLEIIYQSLVAVTVTSPDYETLMVIQSARRLYNTKGKKLPLPMVVELNRRLVKGYAHYKDDPRIVSLRKEIASYNKQLRILGIRDHQVAYAKFSIVQVVATLIYRLVKLALLTIGTLPVERGIGSIQCEAARPRRHGDLEVAHCPCLAPAVYASYTTALAIWTYRNRIQGTVPDWVPLWLVVISSMVLFPTITFAALRIGEVGMDIIKSLRPLVLSLNPSSANSLNKLREKRAALAEQVDDAINTLGPELFPDFDAARIMSDPFREAEEVAAEGGPMSKPTTSPELGQAEEGSPFQEPLPRNESFHNLANIGFFSTRPPSRDRSRSNSAAPRPGSRHGLKPLSPLSAKDPLEDVSSRIRDAMRERGQRRRRMSEDGSWDMASSGRTTPSNSEEFRKDL